MLEKLKNLVNELDKDLYRYQEDLDFAISECDQDEIRFHQGLIRGTEDIKELIQEIIDK